MILAFDTETTGLDPWHGCRPFMAQFLNDLGSSSVYRWSVNGFTREVEIPNSEKMEIYELLDVADLIVGHHIKFDLRMLEVAGIPFPENIWDKVQDTLPMSHILRSRGPHGLKELAETFLKYPKTDESKLAEATKSARRVAEKIGWRIAKEGDPHWPTHKNKQFWKSDYWIPGQLCEHLQELGESNPEDDTLPYLIDHVQNDWWTVTETYGLGDVERNLGLYFFFMQAMEDEGLIHLYEARRQLIRRTYEMESRGLTLRKFLCPRVQQKHESIARVHYSKVVNYAGGQLINLDSPKQLSTAMYDVLKMPVVKWTEGGNPSTDKDAIAELLLHYREHSVQSRFLRNLSGWRKRDHAAGTVHSYLLGGIDYADPRLKAFSVLHPNFNITGTDTTRFSSNDPNGQNIAKGENLPKEEMFNLRDLFGPTLGRRWFSHDYSNQEMRIFAYSAGERSLIDAFERGEAVHLIIARELYPREYDQCLKDGVSFKDRYKSTLYQWIKNGNFALIYGAGRKRANQTYHYQGAYELIRTRFKKIDSFMETMNNQAKQRGYIECLGGYRLEVPSGEPHKAVNYFVQGSAGWAMTLSMGRIGDYLDTLDNHYMLLTVHDELLHDVPDAYLPSFPYDVRYLMELAGNDLGMPLPVEMSMIRCSWDQPEEVSTRRSRAVRQPLKRLTTT